MLVPIKPTMDMKMAGAEAITLEIMRANANYDAADDAWAAMLKAAPPSLPDNRVAGLVEALELLDQIEANTPLDFRAETVRRQRVIRTALIKFRGEV